MRDPIYPGRGNTGTSGSPERDSGWTGRGCPGTAEQWCAAETYKDQTTGGHFDTGMPSYCYYIYAS